MYGSKMVDHSTNTINRIPGVMGNNSIILNLNLNNSTRSIKSNNIGASNTNSTRMQTTLAPSGKYHAHYRFGSNQDRRQQRNNSSMDFVNQKELPQISGRKPAYKQFLRARGSDGFNSLSKYEE